MTPPALAHYNALVAARGLTTGGGRPLRFVPPDATPLGYEERAYRRGEVETRPDNWHDAYNAEVWLEFPRAKTVINRRHFEALSEQRDIGDPRRGQIRDRLTQFDECGVVIAGLRGELWQALCEHRWREVFVDHREEARAASFLIFGHASRDSLRAPFVGLCGKALWLDTTSRDLETLDQLLARRLASADFRARWPALPLLGIPGLAADNEDPAYYDDTRQFRPQSASAGVADPHRAKYRITSVVKESP